MARKTEIAKKIVLAMVDNTGLRVTGRYHDRLCQLAETESFPEARAAVWSDANDHRLAQVKSHIATEAANHVWIGYFILNDTADVLNRARHLALKAATN